LYGLVALTEVKLIDKEFFFKRVWWQDRVDQLSLELWQLGSDFYVFFDERDLVRKDLWDQLCQKEILHCKRVLLQFGEGLIDKEFFFKLFWWQHRASQLNLKLWQLGSDFYVFFDERDLVRKDLWDQLCQKEILHCKRVLLQFGEGLIDKEFFFGHVWWQDRASQLSLELWRLGNDFYVFFDEQG